MDSAREQISIDRLFELKGADRSAKAYAFLYAAFKKSEISSSPVRDAIDCLTPFIVPYLNEISGRQIELPKMQLFLKENFGFDIPIYALEQLVPSLAKDGLAEFIKTARVYVAKRSDTSFEVARTEIDTDIVGLSARLAAHAERLGFVGLPPAGTWDAALLTFLRNQTAESPASFANIKGALINPREAEAAIVASFIRELHRYQSHSFDALLRVFMGTLIEEFISSVSEVGVIGKTGSVKIFYDTAVLLRVLGCSGKMHKVSADELTRYLQDLGFEIHYFSGNEAEVANILNALIYKKDVGKELEGETAEAIANGEVSITDLRMLQNTFPERLAQMSIFPAGSLEGSAQSLAQYQIDEVAFSAFLISEANKLKRVYGVKNRENDSSYLGSVMRLRKGLKTNDLAESRFTFVTSNRFLANASRRFLIGAKVLKPQHCPPMMSVGQVATIAWLLKDHQLEPAKAERELLSNCVAAIRPDAEWFGYFREGMEKKVGPLEEYGRDRGNLIALQAARRIAQEESFGNSALVRQLNLVEILGRARDEAEAHFQASESAAAEERTRLIGETSQLARQNVLAEIEARNESRARAIAEYVVQFAKISFFLLFLVALLIALYGQARSDSSALFVSIGLILIFPAAFGFLDMVGFSPAKRFFSHLERIIAKKVLFYLA